MKLLKSRMIAIATTFTIAIWTGAVTMASAQVPPPQGPPPATANAGGLGAQDITDSLMQKVNEKLAAINAQHDGVEDNDPNTPPDDPDRRFRLTASVERWAPRMTQTEYIDRPNQRIARVPYIVTYHVSNIRAKKAGVFISYPFSRTITHSMDMDVSCEKWYTGVGALTITPRIDPPYLEGDHSFIEDVFGALLNNYIPDYVDSQIRQTLRNFQPGFGSSTTQFGCNTLGVSVVEGAQDAILFDLLSQTRRPLHIAALQQDITVQVTQVKRLQLHDLHGAVLYEPVESPNLQIYASYDTTQLDLPVMTEGSFVTLGPNTVRTQVPGDGMQLVLIGSLTYDNALGLTDSNFLVFGKNSNFGNGTQTLTIYKSWFENSPFLGGKPIKMTGKAYEVTLQITGPILTNLTANPGGTSTGGGGGVVGPVTNIGIRAGGVLAPR